jgi:hypothetical protein
MGARTKLNKLLRKRNDLELEVDGHRNVKEQLYDMLFAGEPSEEREVRWKWIVLEVRKLLDKQPKCPLTNQPVRNERITQ